MGPGREKSGNDNLSYAKRDLEAKKRHVRRALQTRRHKCHWPGCTQEVPPARWSCYFHWMKLPKYLRDEIWAAYAPGQEEGEPSVSAEYLKVSRRAQKWIKQKEG